MSVLLSIGIIFLLLTMAAHLDQAGTGVAADKFYEAASKPKEVKFYDADHDMSMEEVRLDRQEWLLDKLT